jgi:hypothetical protein
MDSTGATANMKSSQVKEGSMHSVTLSRFVGMIPTPTAQDFKRRGPNSKQQGLSNTENYTEGQSVGQASQLNPRFVAEMMGFPPDWTELPFQSGDKNP